MVGSGTPQQQGMVPAAAALGAMRRLEASGVPTAFPHPSQLYEQLLSKQWQAALCLGAQYRLPPTTTLNRALVAAAPRRAARSALAALAALRAAAGRGSGGESTGGGAPHLGVIKLGYAWEATQVLGALGVR